MSCAEKVTSYLKAFIKKKKCTIKEISDRTGIEYQRLRNCISEKKNAEYNRDEIVALAKVFDVSCHELLTGEKDENRLVRADLGLSDVACDYLHILNQKRKESPSEYVRNKVINLLLSGKADMLLDDLGKYLFADFTKAYPISEGGMKWEEIDGVGFSGQNYTTINVDVSLIRYAILQAITDDLNKLKGDTDNEKGKR